MTLHEDERRVMLGECAQATSGKLHRETVTTTQEPGGLTYSVKEVSKIAPRKINSRGQAIGTES